MQGTQGPTNTDAGADRWQINDDVIRLREWATDRCHTLPTAPGTDWIIGSGAESWLRLEDEKGRVSRRHASLSRRDDKWVLQDVGSKNGIVVDGTKRDEIVLEPGLEILLGGVILVAESSRLVALRSFLERLLGWSNEQTRAVDLALHTVRNAATRQTALVLCGVGDLVAIARGLHRHALGAERPFIVCDPRRQQTDENVRAAENYRTGAEALDAARTGALCVWNRSLPPDFTSVTDLLKDPDTRVQLIVCAKDAAEAETFGATPIVIPSLAERSRELARIVEEYAGDATEALGVPRTQFLREDRDWVVENAAESLPEIEKATLRLLAIREEKGNMNRAAARLGMGRWSLSKWARRRKLTIPTDDTEP